jgi:lipid-A-disaccharide synthase
MLRPRHIVIIAGEASGDHYASELIQQLKAHDPSVKISGIGGSQMQQSGAEVINDLAQYGVTGIWEVLRHLRRIKQAFQDIKQHLTVTQPDLLLLIDYPGFNLRLAKFAKQTLNLRIIYYISPQIWAWKANRIHTIRQNIDHMAVILPFEKNIYQQAGVPVSFVGHPLIEKCIPKIRHSFPANKRLLAVLPGSRRHEIEQHMPIFRDTALVLLKKYPDLHLVIPVAHTLNKQRIEKYLEKTVLSYTLVSGNLAESVPACEAAMVASGTASLECALFEVPLCIVYKGAWLSYLIACQVIRVRYFALCNLLENAMIAPEFLQYDCTVPELAKTVAKLLSDAPYRAHMKKTLHKMKNHLSQQAADSCLVDIIQQHLTCIGASLI